MVSDFCRLVVTRILVVSMYPPIRCSTNHCFPCPLGFHCKISSQVRPVSGIRTYANAYTSSEKLKKKKRFKYAIKIEG